jgi:peroxiredoxin Q/BCP
MPIQAGILAPDFTLEDEREISHTLSSYRGKLVVLYFYPKDDTPGCTKEACNFRDDYSVYEKAGVIILGISPDDSNSHAKFIEKYSLPFTLLADIGHKVCDLYGVWGPKTSMGRTYDGLHRTTFVINRDGYISSVFENVKPDGHSTEIIDILRIQSA